MEHFVHAGINFGPFWVSLYFIHELFQAFEARPGRHACAWTTSQTFRMFHRKLLTSFFWFFKQNSANSTSQYICWIFLKRAHDEVNCVHASLTKINKSIMIFIKGITIGNDDVTLLSEVVRKNKQARLPLTSPRLIRSIINLFFRNCCAN